jgi:hypothetical protein
MILRNSERMEFKKCMAAWNWRYNQGLVPRSQKQDARFFGTCWHYVWAEMYTPPPGKDGFTRADIDPHELWDQLMRDSYMKISCDPFFDDDKEKEFMDAQELGHIMINGQIALWNLDPAWEVLAPEQRFRMKVPFNERQKAMGWANFGGLTHITDIVGTFDMVIRDHGSGAPVPKIIDWKTTNRSDNSKKLNIDDQCGTYMAVATKTMRKEGLIREDEVIEDMIFSFARKGKPPENADENGVVRNMPTVADYRDALGLSDNDIKGLKKEKLIELADTAGIKVWGARSKNQGSQLFWREAVRRNHANRARSISRIADDAEAMMAVRGGRLPILKSPNPGCSWCDYADLCDIDEDGGDTETFIKDVFKYENPYSDHEDGAVNSKKLENKDKK